MEVVARRGLGATVDEIAQVAGVHLRTVFRHYPTHDQLIASTINDMFEASGLPPSGTDVDRWFGSLPQRVDDVDEWIEKLAHTAHIGNAEVFGAVFWDIAALRQDKSDALAELDALRADYRRRGIAYIVGTAWRSSGGVGDPPESLTMTFALVLSAFSTQALMIDFDRTPAQAGALAAEILKTVLRDALRAQPSSD
jgi:AcrR family transcriptional regulator